MTKLKNLRNAQVLAAIVLVILGTVFAMLELPIPEFMNELVMAVIAVLVALGICYQTGGNPQPLTMESILEKLKSPILWTALIALADFIRTLDIGLKASTTIGKVILVAEALIIILGQINDPNDRDNIRKVTKQRDLNTN